jgi:heme-degrading monooxygenase HmoA
VSTADLNSQSMVLASDYRVPNPDRVWPLLQRRKSALADIGAHHVLLYKSTQDYGRVLVTIGVRSREPIVELLRSRVFFDWFDAVGVQDIPAVFAGEIVERFESAAGSDPRAPGIVLAAVAPVDNVAALTAAVRAAWHRFTAAGVRKTWLFQAFDDGQEVMILQEFDDEAAAQRWIDQPDIAAEWMTGPGVGAYPPLFVGRFTDVMRIEAGR